MKKMLTLFLFMTNKCNFKCKYCIQDDNKHVQTIQDLDVDKVISFLNLLLKHELSTKFDELRIVFFGGEPLLKKNEILYLLNYYENSKFEFHIITNLSLIMKDIDKFYPFIKNKRLIICASYDGFALHNYNRPYITGENSGNDIRNIIVELCKDYKLTKENLTFESTMDLNKYFLESHQDLMDISSEYGINSSSNVLKSLFKKFNETDTDILYDEYNDILEKTVLLNVEFYKKNKRTFWNLFRKNNVECNGAIRFIELTNLVQYIYCIDSNSISNCISKCYYRSPFSFENFKTFEEFKNMETLNLKAIMAFKRCEKYNLLSTKCKCFYNRLGFYKFIDPYNRKYHRMIS
jgi:uncharacterized protein